MWGSVCWLSAICEHCCSQSPMPCLWHCFLSGRLCADSAAWWGRREGSRLLPDFFWVYTKAREQYTASESCHTAGHVSRYNTQTHVYTCMHMHTLTLARLVEWIFEIPEQRVQKFCRWMKVCVFTWVELLHSPPAFTVHWSSPVLVPLIQTWAPLGWDLEPGTICTDSQCRLLYSVLHTSCFSEFVYSLIVLWMNWGR